jgi:hypothetical protein
VIQEFLEAEMAEAVGAEKRASRGALKLSKRLLPTTMNPAPDNKIP